jgi:hypothetical protein
MLYDKRTDPVSEHSHAPVRLLPWNSTDQVVHGLRRQLPAIVNRMHRGKLLLEHEKSRQIVDARISLT